MKLLLTSNGFMNTPLEKDFLEMTNNKTNLRVVIIPTASDPIEWIPEREGSTVYIAKLIPEKKDENMAWLNSYIEKWVEKGHDVVIADLKEDPVELKKKIESAQVIDVTGGDINWLLTWAKKSKIDSYLKDVLDKNVVYVGASAGSMVLTPDIGLSWWDKDNPEDHVGLGVVDFLITPHQKENEEQSNVEKLTARRDHLQSVISFPWTIYLLQDGQAIKVIDDRVEHIGDGIKKSI